MSTPISSTITTQQELVTLKDGTQVSKQSSKAVMAAFQYLLSEEEAEVGLFALYELHQKCVNPNYDFWLMSDSETILQKYSIIQADGKIAKDIQKIALNSIVEDDDGLSVTLVDPEQKV